MYITLRWDTGLVGLCKGVKVRAITSICTANCYAIIIIITTIHNMISMIYSLSLIHISEPTRPC